MTHIVPDDSDLFTFDEPAALEPFLAAVRAVARDAIGRSAAHTAPRVRDLGLAEVLPELARPEVYALLFHAACEIGRTDPTAGWVGLHDAASVLIGAGAVGPVALALPRAEASHERPHDATHWFVALPAPVDHGSVFACDPARGRLRGSWLADDAALQAAWAAGRPLSALDEGRLCIVEAPDASDGAGSLAPGAWEAFANAHTAMLTGLLAGASARLADEAVAYAQQRQSAGKPIAQHQAVALRLADMAMNQAALSLQLGTLSVQGAWLSSAHVIGTATPAACAIARDALQTAAAHGFVEGLPFKRLHEQVYALSALLNGWRPFLSPASSELT